MGLFMPVPRRDRCIGKVPLHWVLVVPFMLLTTGAVGLVGYFSYRSGQKAVENMAYQLLAQTSQRVSDRLDSYLQQQQQTIKTHRVAVEQGTLDIQNSQAINDRLWQTLALSPSLSSSVFQSAQGQQFGYIRLQNQDLVALAARLSGQSLPQKSVLAQRIDNPATWQQTFSRVDVWGKPIQTVYSVVNDVRTTPWFRMAQASPQQAWSPIFVYQNAPTIGMLAVSPVYDKNRTFRGAFLAGVTLSEMSTFLHELDFSPAGQSFIVERSGNLVASSTLELPFIRPSQGKPQRLLATQSQNPMTREIAQQLLQQWGDFQHLKTATRLNLTNGQDQNFIQATPYQDQYGLDWIIITVVPESDLIQEINRNTWWTFLLSGLTLLGTTATGILVAFWIARPIQRLSRASQALAKGEWQYSLEEESRIAELSVLAQAFNQTAEQLQDSFDRIKTALAESEEKFTTVFRTSPDPIVITTFPTDRVLEANNQASDFFASAPSDLIGRTASDLGLWSNPVERDRWLAMLHRDRKVYNFEITVRTPAQAIKTALLSAEVHDLLGQPCVILMLRDISDRKQVEDQLRKTEKWLHQHSRLSPTNVYILVQESDGHVWFEYISAAVEALHEFSVEQVLQDASLILGTIHPDDRAGYEAAVLASLHSLSPFSYEWRIITPSGQLKWLHANSQPERRDTGAVAWYGVVVEISDRKAAEAKLRQSEMNLKKAQALAHLGNWEFDSATGQVYWSEEMYRIHGLSPQVDSPVGMGTLHHIHPDDQAKYRQDVLAQADQGQGFATDLRIVTPTGTVRYIEALGQPIWDDQPQLVGFRGTVQDITDRKLAETALRHSEATNRALLQSVPDLFVQMDRQGNYLQVLNPGNLNLFNPDVLHQCKNITEVMPAEFAQERLHYIERALQTQTTQIYEYQLDVQGKMQYEEARVTPCTEDSVLIIVRDISDRKRAEVALKQTLQELTYHVEHSPLATIRWNREFRVEGWSKQAELMFGWRAEEVVGKTMYDWPFIFEDDLEFVHQTSAQLLRGEATLCLNRNYHKDGSVVYCEWYNSALLDENGVLISILSLTQDVTQRTLAETALRHSEARFQKLGAASPGVIYTVVESLAGPVRFEYVNAAFEEIHEIPVAAVLQDASLVAQQIHPDDLATYQQAVAQSLATMQPFRHEWRIITPSGTVKWIQANSRPEYQPNGDVVWHGIVLDVSERKRIEAERQQAVMALQRNEEQMRLLADALPVFISYADTEQRYQFVNKMYEQQFGLRREAMQGRYVGDIIGEPNYALSRPYIERVLTGESVSYEIQVPGPVSDRFLSVVLVPDFADDQQVRGYYSLVIDISDRKAFERSLQRYERIVSATADAMALVDRNYCYQIVNQTYLNWHNRTYGEIVGHSIPALLGEAVFCEVIKPNLDLCLIGETVQYSDWFEFESLGPQYVNVTYSPYLETDQTISGVVVSVRNITAVKQAEQQLQAEADLRRAIEGAIVEGIAVADMDGRQIYVNPAFCSMLGWSEAELLGGTPPYLYWPPEEVDHITQAFAACLQGDRPPEGLELRFQRRNGERFDVLILDAPLQDATGTTTAWLASVYDITDRKRAEAALSSSEARLRAILTAIPDIIFLYTVDGIFLDAMQAGSLLSLVQDPHPVGKHIDELLPPEVAERQRQAVQRILATGEPQLYEQEVVVRGVVQYEEVRIVACGENAVLMIIRDIGDRKLREIDRQLAEEALRESEERFRRAFDDAAIGMAWVDMNGRFLKVSQSLTEIVGYTEAELLACRFHDITHPDDLAIDLDFSARMLSGEQRAYQREKRYIHQQGHIIWVLVNVSLVRDRTGNPLYFVSQIQDISDRHELDRIKDEFISIVSHELRTPLTAIRGSLGILDTGVLDHEPDTAKQMLQVALNNSERLVRLVNDILDLERLESGKLTLTLELCRIEDLLQQALESVQAIALQDRITIQVDAIATEIEAAPDAIVQAIVNLLGNAIKFSNPGSTIWLKAATWNQSVAAPLPEGITPTSPAILFAIQDQGRGIPPEKLETIFGRFQQVDVSDSRQKGGTGLGLAICKSIVQQHSGTIWAESVLGAGSTFYFTIPTRKTHE
jgi:PAS domain S-box-containing protein